MMLMFAIILMRQNETVKGKNEFVGISQMGNNAINVTIPPDVKPKYRPSSEPSLIAAKNDFGSFVLGVEIVFVDFISISDRKS